MVLWTLDVNGPILYSGGGTQQSQSSRQKSPQGNGTIQLAHNQGDLCQALRLRRGEAAASATILSALQAWSTLWPTQFQLFRPPPLSTSLQLGGTLTTICSSSACLQCRSPAPIGAGLFIGTTCCPLLGEVPYSTFATAITLANVGHRYYSSTELGCLFNSVLQSAVGTSGQIVFCFVFAFTSLWWSFAHTITLDKNHLGR